MTWERAPCPRDTRATSSPRLPRAIHSPTRRKSRRGTQNAKPALLAGGNPLRLNNRPAARGKRASAPRALRSRLDAPGASEVPERCKHQSSSRAASGRAATRGQARSPSTSATRKSRQSPDAGPRLMPPGTTNHLCSASAAGQVPRPSRRHRHLPPTFKCRERETAVAIAMVMSAMRIERKFAPCLSSRVWPEGSHVEVEVEHPHVGDLVDRQPVASGGPANRLRSWPVVDAECRALVVARVRVHPRDAFRAFRSTTVWHSSEPPFPARIWRPSGKVR